MRRLTKKQAMILDFIEQEVAKGFPPTLREICKRFEFVSTRAAGEHLERLDRKHRIHVSACVSRGIKVVVPLTDRERERFGLRLRAPRRERDRRTFIPATRCALHEVVTVGIPCPECVMAGVA